MKRTFAFAVVLALAAHGPAVAQSEVKNQQKILDQNISIVQSTGFTMNAEAHTAQLTGKGSATLDGGDILVKPGASITVNFTNAGDAPFQQCADVFSASAGGPLNISGHGFYSLGVQDGVVSQATITLESVTACDAAGGGQ